MTCLLHFKNSPIFLFPPKKLAIDNQYRLSYNLYICSKPDVKKRQVSVRLDYLGRDNSQDTGVRHVFKQSQRIERRKEGNDKRRKCIAEF